MKKVNIVPPGEFPRDIWPTCLQRALKYVMNVSQAPDSLIIPLMLSVMSLACQDLVEVQVNEILKILNYEKSYYKNFTNINAIETYLQPHLDSIKVNHIEKIFRFITAELYLRDVNAKTK